MKASNIISLIFLTFSITISAQTSEKVNPKGKWFLGVEVGENGT